MSKHAPGPWIAERQIDLEGKALSMIDIWTNNEKPRYIGEIQREENARLIAAAPDLLDALQGTIEWAELMGTDERNSRLVAARAAIAKATEGKP